MTWGFSIWYRDPFFLAFPLCPRPWSSLLGLNSLSCAVTSKWIQSIICPRKKWRTKSMRFSVWSLHFLSAGSSNSRSQPLPSSSWHTHTSSHFSRPTGVQSGVLSLLSNSCAHKPGFYGYCRYLNASSSSARISPDRAKISPSPICQNVLLLQLLQCFNNCERVQKGICRERLSNEW